MAIFIGTFFNGYITIKLFSLRKETMILSDQRAKNMSECINGIRIIKYFGWENFIIKRL